MAAWGPVFWSVGLPDWRCWFGLFWGSWFWYALLIRECPGCALPVASARARRSPGWVSCWVSPRSFVWVLTIQKLLCDMATLPSWPYHVSTSESFPTTEGWEGLEIHTPSSFCLLRLHGSFTWLQPPPAVYGSHTVGSLWVQAHSWSLIWMGELRHMRSVSFCLLLSHTPLGYEPGSVVTLKFYLMRIHPLTYPYLSWGSKSLTSLSVLLGPGSSGLLLMWELWD